MIRKFQRYSFMLVVPLLASCASPKLAGVSTAMRSAVKAQDVSGAVTVVATRDQVLHCDATGLANLTNREPMRPDSLFWIASMTKPVTAVAVLMLQDEGKLKITDPIAKYIPEFAGLKTPSGQPADLTLAQVMTHTSGLGEAPREAAANAHTLADLIPAYLAAPMQFEPGTKWNYCQSGINTASRIVEIVSGLSFDVFLQQRIFDPLGMKNTTFYPSRKPSAHLVGTCRKNRATGALEMAAPPAGFGTEGRPALGNGGLFSTGPDYARFCQMLLAGGTLNGKRYLSPEAMKLLTTVQTGDLPTGFFSIRRPRQPRHELRLGHRHLHFARAPPGHRRHALARYLRPWRRLGHPGLDRSHAGCRLRAHDPTLGHRQQRRQ
jgi:CubicO group peptidase (beta-lactamase class C family)